MRAKVCALAQVAEAALPCACLGHCSSRHKLSEDIVTFSMGFLGKRITDTLPETVRIAPSALPPNRRSLLAAPQAALNGWIRPIA